MLPTIEEEDAFWRAEAARTRLPLTPPTRWSCATCPWRIKYAETGNKHFSDPCASVCEAAWEGDYGDGTTAAKDGLILLCHGHIHQDDPEEQWDRNELCVCTSVVVVQQREAIRWHERGCLHIDQAAAERIAARMGIPPALFRSRTLTRADLLSRAHPAISDPHIGHSSLPAMLPGEFEYDTADVKLWDVVVDFDPARPARRRAGVRGPRRADGACAGVEREACRLLDGGGASWLACSSKSTARPPRRRSAANAADASSAAPPASHAYAATCSGSRSQTGKRASSCGPSSPRRARPGRRSRSRGRWRRPRSSRARLPAKRARGGSLDAVRPEFAEVYRRRRLRYGREEHTSRTRSAAGL